MDNGAEPDGPGVARRPVTGDQARRANRSWWDGDAAAYQEQHGDFLGDADFRWCPEGLREESARLLGDPAGRRIVEVGCGAAAAARWLRRQGADVVALDLSAGMLRQARLLEKQTGVRVPLVQADAVRLPLRSAAFDIACTAFGAIPFVADSGALMREVYRVLRPGGRWVFSVTHPMRWIFLDDPGEAGLVAVHSYFDRSLYVEYDDTGTPTYVEQHRTLGDRIRELVDAGFVVTDIVEPEWPAGHEQVWGQWSPLRGTLFPGTAIFVTHKPESVSGIVDPMSTSPIARTPGPRAWHPDPGRQGRADYTVDDVLNLPWYAPRVELDDGVMVLVPSPAAHHQDVAFLLRLWFHRNTPSDLKSTLAVGVMVSSNRTYEPDVILRHADGDDSRHFFPPEQVVIAIEVVSPGTRARDRITKPAGYAAAGIPHYWRVEQNPLHIYAYSLGANGHYELVADSAKELVLEEPFPIRLPISEIIP